MRERERRERERERESGGVVGVPVRPTIPTVEPAAIVTEIIQKRKNILNNNIIINNK
jgi:hypothetical protein